MAISDASAIDTAICEMLAADAELMAVMPDGVWMDIAPPNSRQFVIVALLEQGQESLLEQGTAWEISTYLVKAVSFGSSGVPVRSAAARIHELMHNATINAVGYTAMRSSRIQRIRYPEPNDAGEIIWQHRGGHYELWMIPEG